MMRFLKKSPPKKERRRVMTPGRAQRLSYHSYRSEEEITNRRTSPDAKALKRNSHTSLSWLQRFGALILIVALVIAAVNVVIVSPDPRVLSIDPSRTNYLHPVSVYQQAA